MGPGNVHIFICCGYMGECICKIYIKNLCPLGKFCRVVGKLQMMFISLFPCKSFIHLAFPFCLLSMLN